MTDKKNKVYGLILSKKTDLKKPNTAVEKKANIFNDDSSDDDVPTDWRKKSLGGTNLNRVKKQTQVTLSKALEEDPTVFQYDEVFENMEAEKAAKSAEEAQNKKNQEKKPRYISSLLKQAEIRNRERERRIEKMVQKEREAEGDEFADKESFVTSAYRKKMEELQKLEEEERKQDQVEELLNVTKQRDMSGFYRHLYRQTMGEEKGQSEVKEPKTDPIVDNVEKEVEDETSREIDAKFTSKKIKPRGYRKTQEEDSDGSGSEEDSSGSSDEKTESDDDNVRQTEQEKAEMDKKRKEDLREQKAKRERRKRKIDHGDSSSDEEEPSVKEDQENVESSPVVKEEKPYIKKDKSLVWIKITIGQNFDEALKRYLQRKAERNENFW